VTSEIKRGEVWTLPDGRDVLVVSLTGLDEAYGAVLAIVLHPAGRYPDTAMSVVISDPVDCTAVAVNLQQLRSTRFAEASLRGAVAPDVMARVDQALRAVLDL
jgi:mRNA interferase MazF